MEHVSFFRECALCGSNATLVYRWYQYDNGEQSRIPVCPKCAGLHSSLVKGKK
jgi:protein-arginine kinase activator protein McsA